MAFIREGAFIRINTVFYTSDVSLKGQSSSQAKGTKFTSFLTQLPLKLPRGLFTSSKKVIKL